MVLHLNCMLVGWCEAHTPAAFHAYNFQRAFAPDKQRPVLLGEHRPVSSAVFSHSFLWKWSDCATSLLRLDGPLNVWGRSTSLRPLVTVPFSNHAVCDAHIELQQGQRSAASHARTPVSMSESVTPCRRGFLRVASKTHGCR